MTSAARLLLRGNGERATLVLNGPWVQEEKKKTDTHTQSDTFGHFLPEIVAHKDLGATNLPRAQAVL